MHGGNTPARFHVLNHHPLGDRVLWLTTVEEHTPDDPTAVPGNRLAAWIITHRHCAARASIEECSAAGNVLEPGLQMLELPGEFGTFREIGDNTLSPALPSSMPQNVRSLFDAIAHRYDLLNHLLSGGIDIYWRRRAIEQIREIKPRRILDVATGTGDFAIATARLGPEQVVGVDISPHMLARGQAKLARRGLERVIELMEGQAEELAFPAGSFDAVIVAFGVRNFEDLTLGLREMRRVLRGGGAILVLEFSLPRRFPFRQVYLLYFRKILPLIGRLISGHDDAYAYLHRTVMQFPEGSEFRRHLEAAGFVDVRESRMTFGIVTAYTGRCPYPRE